MFSGILEDLLVFKVGIVFYVLSHGPLLDCCEVCSMSPHSLEYVVGMFWVPD